MGQKNRQLGTTAGLCVASPIEGSGLLRVHEPRRAGDPVTIRDAAWGPAQLLAPGHGVGRPGHTPHHGGRITDSSHHGELTQASWAAARSLLPEPNALPLTHTVGSAELAPGMDSWCQAGQPDQLLSGVGEGWGMQEHGLLEREGPRELQIQAPLRRARHLPWARRIQAARPRRASVGSRCPRGAILALPWFPRRAQAAAQAWAAATGSESRAGRTAVPHQACGGEMPCCPLQHSQCTEQNGAGWGGRLPPNTKSQGPEPPDAAQRWLWVPILATTSCHTSPG